LKFCELRQPSAQRAYIWKLQPKTTNQCVHKILLLLKGFYTSVVMVVGSWWLKVQNMNH